ncbi:hypothetical protein [Aquimarina brevivitae]|uniref:Adhesin n=1 Tax=Aquimarina brevivitae TaxID=323412 RepID=A0A4Q7PGB4_9FLAO|nr:hypothetical protein [Aquimarina brevivitae]RZS99405.1 hypothetical protein EV197_0615 [Aquimarina brevivitae]
MKFQYLLLSFLLSMVGYGQSTVDKIIDAEGIQKVIIKLDKTAKVKIETTTTNRITLSAISEGEYKDHLLFDSTRDNTVLNISEVKQPFVAQFNDKLSAHKIHAMSIIVKLPIDLSVEVFAKNSSLHINGEYELVFVELFSGDCLLKPFIGDAKINTVNANISVYTKNANINAQTKLGKINKTPIQGSNRLELTSIRGDINIHRMQ